MKDRNLKHAVWQEKYDQSLTSPESQEDFYLILITLLENLTRASMLGIAKQGFCIDSCSLAGASVYDVVNSRKWIQPKHLYTSYRLSTEALSNFTSLFLGTSGSNSNTMEQQPQDPLTRVM
jgi:hypothetical protein